MNNKAVAYILWALWPVCGLAGLHRFYNKRYTSGCIWILTFGLFGVGQIIDLFFIPDMVEEHNVALQAKLGMSPYGVPMTGSNVPAQVIQSQRPRTADQLMVELAKAAHNNNGRLSVTQAVIATGCTFEEAEKTLRAMFKSGYVGLGNDPDSGAVVYEFVEL
ncbi:MAG: NINE protein [Leptolyngbya sp. DLM2.Bin15]|nr:MAG: NINE protein [Leptolyngbya sp. DLM2.Bin15]